MKLSYIILTASDERQAEAYRYYLQIKEKQGALPEWAEFLVISDPPKGRVGSGGSTLHVIKELVLRYGLESILTAHIFCIHSGGESSRIPQYSALGKVFAPIAINSYDSIFDCWIELYRSILHRLPCGIMAVSGDVLLQIETAELDIPMEGAFAISVPTDIETGTRHGVFCINEKKQLLEFLHKRSCSTLMDHNAVRNGKVLIDTGVVFFDSSIIQTLYQLICSHGSLDNTKASRMIAPHIRLSLYGDFLFPLAELSTLILYQAERTEGIADYDLITVRKELWNALRPYHMQVVADEKGQFIHLGTSREVHDHMVADNGSYIEASLVHTNAEIGHNCIISQTEIEDQTVPDGTVIHTLPLRDGTFVTRIWGLCDNPKEPKWFGRALPKGDSLWNTPLFTPRETIKESVDEAIRIHEAFLSGRMNVSEKAMSLADVYQMADMIKVIDWQKESSYRTASEKLETEYYYLSQGGSIQKDIVKIMWKSGSHFA